MKTLVHQARYFKWHWSSVLLACAMTLASQSASSALPTLADAPFGASVVVPANVILDLSVEFPTAVSDAYYSTGNNYTTGTEFTGYFNPNWCYDYGKNTAYTGATDIQFGKLTGYFQPVSGAPATNHACSGHWSGNFLNWIMTQTIDPLRKTLTGGARIVDKANATILQKAYQDNQGGGSNQFVKSITNATLVHGATPFSNWSKIYVNNLNTGLNFAFSQSSISTGNTSGLELSNYAILTTNSSANSNVNYATNATIYQAQSAVQVCSSVDAPSDLESAGGRCRAYGSNYKPVGLMQKYAAEQVGQTDSIRYAVFGYLQDSDGGTGNQKLDGGVMRAKMKSVGPLQASPGTNPISNPNAEWDAGTGVFATNPNPTDASATTKDASDPSTGVANSGVVNYLNKFGFVSTAVTNAAQNGTVVSAYKRYDSVSELFYMATRYYRALTNLSSHTSTGPAASEIAAGRATNDNFPVITNWDDPIAYTCSTNYIVGIGDIHTWNDANLPGSTLNGGYEVADSQVSSDNGVNVQTQTNAIAALESAAGDTGGTTGRSSYYTPIATLGNALIPNISSPSGGWGAGGNSFLMAGLAYDAHTRDIRPDITNKTTPVTVSTFWLDVMESNDYHQKNQFWMTAKYGGFNTADTTSFPNGYVQGQTAPLPLASWNTGGYVDDHKNYAPDQYFQAGNPGAMKTGLNNAFAKIAASVPAGTSNALSLGSNTLSASGNLNYVTSYANDWSGDVVAQQLTTTLAGNVISSTSTALWDAHNWLPPNTSSTAGLPSGVTPLTAATRIIATSTSASAGSGTPFTYAGITSAEKSKLGTSSVQQSIVNYLRGDQSNEGTTSGKFRPRAYVLGDITNSKPAVVSAPNFPYADTPLNPGYTAFKTANAARSPVLYIGANDGMFHAFDASGVTTGGKELFAYVPTALFTSNTDSAGNPVGLASLILNPLQHHFMVDAQPVVYDIDFNRTGSGAPSVPATAAAAWHTVVMSGTGKGGGAGSGGLSGAATVGGGYFALDVTNPASITSASALTSNVLWETNPSNFSHMGYSYGTPLVVKTKKYGWTVVLTSGYDNDNGQGYIYLVSPVDGSVYETIATGAGSPTAPAGLTYISGYINNYADFTADALYAGDLLGNLWRVDLSSATNTLTAVKFARLTDPSGAAQPVTTEPVVATDPTTLTRYVFVGTGRLLADSDLVNLQTQTFYAFVDGNNAGIDTNTALPITRSNLVSDYNSATSTVTGVTLTASQKGFYIDLAPAATAGPGTQASAERINIQPVASGGILGFAANLYGQNVCLKGSSRLFALSYATTYNSSGNAVLGGSLLLNSSAPAQSVSYFGYSGLITNLTIANVGTGSNAGPALMAGLDTTAAGANQRAQSDVVGDLLKKPSALLVRINWREVPSAQ